MSRQHELLNNSTKLNRRSGLSSDEVHIYSSKYVMELKGRLHISLDSNRPLVEKKM